MDDYVVEKIIGTRRNRGRREYLVVFEGYEEPEWIPRVDLDAAQGKIREYYISLKHSRWRKARGGPRPPPEYRTTDGRQPGVQPEFKEAARSDSTLPLFEMFFPLHWWVRLVKGTNAQMRHKVEKICRAKGITQAKLPNWRTHATNVQELKLYFGIILAMSRCVEPEIHDYWGGGLIHGGHRWRKVAGMSRNRFKWLSACFHWQNPAEIPTDDPGNWWKVDPFLEHLQAISQEAYVCHGHLSCDEGCCPFKGRHIAKVRNPMKPKKVRSTSLAPRSRSH